MQTTLAPTDRLTARPHHDEEALDGQTLALLDALDVPLPNLDDGLDVGLDVLFGTPLELHEPAATIRERRRYAAALATTPADQRFALSHAHAAEIAARVDAARDIVATDPTVTALVRERLVDALLPYAARLRRTICTGRRRTEPAAA
ncbi:hypothetical protein [Streptomyces sp. NPDC088707]|uniref:hypothetical protein n=1 Tax=Streptomyces sp. NPDC088707 TaxID=3365871 RepID=UPI0038104E61